MRLGKKLGRPPKKPREGSAMKAGIKEFDILVRRIKMDNRNDAKTVFDAVVLEWRPIKKEWTQTKQRVTCTGYFYNLVENDHLHVKAEEIEARI